MAQAARDQNFVPTLLAVSSVDGVTPVAVYANPTTHRLLTDTAAGSGTVTDVSVVTANGFAGSVATSTTTPAITLSTTITGILKGNGTAISAATAGTDYTALAFKTISVAGQSDIVADSAADTLTIAAGTNITITTDATTDTLTIAGPTTTGFATTALDNLASVAINAALIPASAAGLDFGSTAKPWKDIWLAGSSGTPGTNQFKITGASTSGVRTITLPDGSTTLPISTQTLTFAGPSAARTITFPDASITVARTDAANTFTGASTASAWVLTSPTITTSIVPTSNDGAALGDATHNFSDLFLASGALINIANGNWVATHSSGILTVTTGDLRVTSANVGTNADSVPTLSSTSTLTNKTLSADTYSGASTISAAATFNLAVPTADGTATGHITSSFNSGATTTFGDLVYLDSSQTWQKAKANSATTSGGVMLGIALATSSTTGIALSVALPGSFIYSTNYSAVTTGVALYSSFTTLGAISSVQPGATDSVTRVIGWAVHAQKIFFNPSPDWITHV